LLAKELNPDFSVFYNGPQCGASAPDHLHFQVSPVGAIPVERDAVNDRYRNMIGLFNQVGVLTLKNYGRSVLVIESADIHTLVVFIHQLLRAWQKITNESHEPKFNIIASYRGNAWRIILFPRQKHRPEIFFKNADERVLISPATVDMGGLIVTPREQDFLHTDAALVQSIYHEVSMDENFLPLLIKQLQAV
jgi:hypothetical protein